MRLAVTCSAAGDWKRLNFRPSRQNPAHTRRKLQAFWKAISLIKARSRRIALSVIGLVWSGLRAELQMLRLSLAALSGIRGSKEAGCRLPACPVNADHDAAAPRRAAAAFLAQEPPREQSEQWSTSRLPTAAHWNAERCKHRPIQGCLPGLRVAEGGPGLIMIGIGGLPTQLP
jgi:hypothetical protein